MITRVCFLFLVIGEEINGRSYSDPTSPLKHSRKWRLILRPSIRINCECAREGAAVFNRGDLGGRRLELLDRGKLWHSAVCSIFLLYCQRRFDKPVAEGLEHFEPGIAHNIHGCGFGLCLQPHGADISVHGGYDQDGVLDSYTSSSPPYNWARPTVHGSGANFTTMDGHSEHTPFKISWQLNSTNGMIWPDWYLSGAH